MRILVLVLLLTLTIPTAGRGQERIGLFGDEVGTTCALNVSAGNLVRVHMIHQGPVSSLAVRFLARIPSCWSGAVWLGDVIAGDFLSLGNTQEELGGLSVAYRTCWELPAYIGYIHIFAQTDVPACCAFAPSPASYGGPEAAYCNSLEHPIGAEGAIINPDASCPCELPVTTEQSTWGRVKSLYR